MLDILVDLKDLLKSKISFLMDTSLDSYIEKDSFVKTVQEDTKILESSWKQLYNEADSRRRYRSTKLKSRYMGISPDRGWIRFVTHSQYTPGLKYTQYIELKDIKDMKYFKEFSPEQVADLMLAGDLKVSCTCPDMRYRFSYKAWTEGYGIKKERRFPKIRNPLLKGSVCKHLLAVLFLVQQNWKQISLDMAKSKYFKKRYYEADYFAKKYDNRQKGNISKNTRRMKFSSKKNKK